MRRRHRPELRSEAEERVERLEAELDETRRDILDMAPDEFSLLLSGYHSGGSREEHHRWEQEVIGAVIARAVPDPGASVWQPRALCPLCRGGSSSPFEQGFTLPEGLRRHLAGFGNVRRCAVTKAAFRMARDYLKDRFSEADEAARRLEDGRRGTERLYLVEPWSAPKLLDEWLFTLAPRTPQELEDAERRLAALGFRTVVDGSVVSYQLARDGRIVFADPRGKGRIDFVVVPEGRRHRMAVPDRFHLLDRWTKDINGTFDRRLARAVEARAAR